MNDTVGRLVFAPKGAPMAQTPEQFSYVHGLYDKGFKEMREEISRLKARINTLEQKLDQARKK